MKESRYHLTLDDFEQGILIRSLNAQRTELIEQNKDTDIVDELIVKVGKAPKKKVKVIER